MARKIHHNQDWISAAQFADLTGHHRCTVLDWAERRLVKIRINPTKKKRVGYQYYLPDIKKITGIN